jgi:hypothetical protein
MGEPAAVLEGWLEKQGERLGLWKRRYFVLGADGALSYFDGDAAATARRLLGGCAIAELVHAVPAGRTRFRIDTSRAGPRYPRCCMHCRAPDAAACERWLAALRSVTGPARLQGWLTKRGHVVKSWRRRYFRLTDGHLAYFRNEQEHRQPRGAVPCGGIGAVVAVLSGGADGGAGSAFKLEARLPAASGAGSCAWELHARADGDDERRVWVTALKQAQRGDLGSGARAAAGGALGASSSAASPAGGGAAAVPNSALLAPEQVAQLTAHMPARYRDCCLAPCYNLLLHGASLTALYAKARSQQSTLLVVQSAGGGICGIFSAVPWCPSTEYYGTGETFVFKVLASGAVDVYRWTRANDLICFSDDSTLAAGGGGGGFGLALNDDLSRGFTNACDTFGNGKLLDNSASGFSCTMVELLAVRAAQ